MAKSSSSASGVEYWKKKLENAEICHFPNLNDDADAKNEFKSISVNVPEEDRLHDFCKTQHLNSPLPFLAAWALVLRCYTGRDDVCFGYRESGAARHRGMVYSLPIHEESEIVDVLKDMNTSYIEGVERNDCSLDQIRQSLYPKGQITFDTELHVYKYETSNMMPGVMHINEGPNNPQTEKSAISINVTFVADQIKAEIIYSTSIITARQASNIISTFETALSCVSKNKQQKIAELELFSDKNAEQLRGMNGKAPKPVEECVHHIFAHHVVRRPDSPAICAWDGKFTYQELDRLSTQLAHRLVGCGVGPEILVPICFEKSAWAIVAILGVLKAGGAFVPIDPSHPIERLRSVVGLLQAKVILGSAETSMLCSQLVDVVVEVSANLDKLPAVSGPCASVVNLRNVAYVIFTSGSTGQPKGVVIEHGAISYSSRSHGKALHFSPEARVLNFASYIFDASITEIITTLIHGGCVCVPSESDRINNITDVMNTMAVNWAFFTPAHVRTIQPNQVPGLKYLALGGDVLGPDNIRNWADKVHLMNAYGPAECSIICLVNDQVKGIGFEKRIGAAVGSVSWIVNPQDHNKLTPIGGIGELLVEGPILARGYLGDDAKTAESFIINPMWSTGSSRQDRRFYKTGDLVRYNSDGSLSFVGRKDNQIKVNGQRVELGDIEYHLSTITQVGSVMVLMPKSGPCKKSLVAVLTLAGDGIELQKFPIGGLQIVDSTQGELARKLVSETSKQLLQHLPQYFVPTVWAVVNKLPLNTSGKMDRAKTRRWVEDWSAKTYQEVAEMSTEKASEAPTTEMEMKIQEVWSRVLNRPVEIMGSNRSFISVGGDSITAMQVASLCRSSGVAVSVQDILKSQSLSQLALSAKSTTTAPTATEEEEIDTDFELSPIQRYNFSLTPEGENHFNQSFSLCLNKKTRAANLHRAIRAIVGRHSMLRARFQNNNGHWTQRITKDIDSSYRFVIKRCSTRQEMAEAAATSQTGLDIVKGPVLAVDLLESQGKQYLFLVAHHLVIDLVSWRIILQDLEEFVETGKISGENTLSYQTWTRLQAKHSREAFTPQKVLPFKVPAANYEFWGMEDCANIGVDAVEESFELDEETTALLLDGCHEALGTEPVEIMLAAVLHAFNKTFPDRAVPTVFTEGHGREPWTADIDVSRTVGWFTTIWPLHVDADEQVSVIEMLKRVKDRRRMIPNSGFPYFSSRYLNAEGIEQFRDHEKAEVIFNYFGLYQQLEREGSLMRQTERLDQGTGDVSQGMPRLALFDIEVTADHGRLKFSFTYNRHMKHQLKILYLFQECEDSIKEAVEQLRVMKPQVTMSDFPLLPLNYGGLDQLMERLKTIGVIDIAEVEDVYPCSPMQQGLLISQTKLSKVYEYYSIWEATSGGGQPVNAGQVEQAWQQVVNRHPILRTVFLEGVSQEGIYDQVVLKHISVTTNTKRLECNDDEVIGTLKDSKGVSFRDQGAPNRLTLCQTTTGRVFCKLEMNHAIVDGYSIWLIVREWALAFNGKLSSDLGGLYSDYISYLQRQNADAGIAHWKVYLKDVQPCQFPSLDDGRSAVAGGEQQSTEIKHVDVELKSTVPDIQKFCEGKGITLSNLFQVAWGLVLRSYTGSGDVCFGYLTSGRDIPLSGINDAIGPYCNMLVCRFDLAEENTIELLLNNAQTDFLSCLPHQHISLAQIQHSLGLSGDGLFNTIMSVQKLQADELCSDENAVCFKEVFIEDPSEFSIGVNVGLSEEKILVNLSYWANVLSPGQAKNVADALSEALECILHRTGDNLGELTLFGEQNMQQISAWNNTPLEALETCVHDTFMERVHSTPGAQAICSWDFNLTYSELDEKSTRLAHYLIGLGVGPEVRVPLCFDKSAYTIVAMLAVLKAGGAIVCLDPSHPMKRKEYLIRTVSAQILLAGPSYCDEFAGLGLKNVVGITPEFLDQLPRITGTPNVGTKSTNAAYVTFTSGSTGVPKGVVMEHGAFCSGSRTHSKAVRMDDTSRVLQFAAYTFDVSVGEILMTLMYGGCVCVPSETDRFNNLAKAMSDMAVNVAFLTPTMARMLQPESVPHLKTLVLGGEKPTVDIYRTWAGKVHLINAYGPAEAAICTACLSGVDARSDTSNIGHPVGARLWIVDSRNPHRLSPLGCVGEVVIEGPLLARGYLDDAKRTDSVFITSPRWLPTPNSRVYRTGDLARYNSDGSLAFIGRKDTQIKIRGHRVELGEVEHAINMVGIPNVSHVAVELITLEHRSGQHQLAAFLCFSDGVSSDHDVDNLVMPVTKNFTMQMMDLEASLGLNVPAYMVPSLFIPLRRMPTVTSGKLDRGKLRNLTAGLSDHQISEFSLDNAEKQAPSTHLETKMQALWAKVLDISASSIGVNDSFFRLGGDSIRAIDLVTVAREADVILTAANIFKNPTLSKMSSVAQSLHQEVPQKQLGQFELLDGTDNQRFLIEVEERYGIIKRSVLDAYPCTPLQEGLMLLSIKQPATYINQSIFHLPTSVDVERFKWAWQVVIQKHHILRTRLVYTKTLRCFQVVLNDQAEWQSATSLDAYLSDDMREPMEFGSSLARYAVIDNEDDTHHFVWTTHHSSYDGWARSLILKEVQSTYSSGDITSSTPKPSASVQFSSFVQHIMDSSKDTQAAENYWQSQFTGATLSAFPESQSGAPEGRADHSLTHTAHLASVDSDITVSIVVRSAWALLISQYSSSNEALFGATLSGRNAPTSGIADIIGPTIATVPIRISIDKQQSVAAFLRQVQDQATDMIPFEQTGLQSIKKVSPEAGFACDFQNLLVFQPADEKVTPDSLWALETNKTSRMGFMSYPWVMECLYRDGKVEMTATFDQKVISPIQMQRILYQFSHLIGQLSLDNNEQKLDHVELFSPQDEAEVLSWNSNSPKVIEECVHEIISRWAVSDPNSAAISSWDGVFTHQELEEKSTDLSHNLYNLGVEAGEVVSLCFEKSATAIIAMLAVIKAGGAFVLFEPSHPESERNEKRQQVGSSILLVSPQTRSAWSAFTGMVVEVSPVMIASLASEESDDELDPVSPSDVMYVSYNSGSTGKATPLAMEHVAVSTSTMALGARIGLNKESRALQFASLASDVCITEIFTTLMCGGCICIPSEVQLLNSTVDFINENNIDWVCFTSTAIQSIEPSHIPNVKTVILAGEPIKKWDIEVWADKVRLINCYGLTETSAFCTTSEVSKGSREQNIGYSAGCLTWVVQAHDSNRLAPVGCAGELVIEGPLLARDYFNDKASTEASFIQDLLWAQKNTSSQPPRRMFKTGDLVRYNPDGSLDFVGRKDNEVKLHGQRIELGDIEYNIHHALTQSAEVAVELVTLSDGPESPEDKHLAAFFTFHGALSPVDEVNSIDVILPLTAALREEMDNLQESLAKSMPGYMLPSLYIPVRKIPVTFSGKRDRGTLQKIIAELSTEQTLMYSLSAATKRRPQTEMEQILHELWCEVLMVPTDSLGSDDNFFHVGGDSIGAMRLVALAQERGYSITVAEIFENPSLADMSTVMSAVVETTTSKELAPFAMAGDSEKRDDMLAKVTALFQF